MSAVERIRELEQQKRAEVEQYRTAMDGVGPKQGLAAKIIAAEAAAVAFATAADVVEGVAF